MGPAPPPRPRAIRVGLTGALRSRKVPGPRGTRRAPPPGPAQKGHVEFSPKAGWGLVLGHFLPWCPNGGIAAGCQIVVTAKPAHLQPGEKSKPANKSTFGGLTKFPRACSWLWLWQRLPQPHGRQSQSEEFPSLKQKPRESGWRGWANTGEASSAKPMANNPSLLRPWTSRPSASSHRVHIS